MRTEFGFNVCRVCLAPESIVPLKSLFAGKARKAHIFQKISGIKIFDELCKNKAVLCDKCSTDLDGVSVIYKKLKDADRYYFEPKRNETRTKATATETNEIQAETKHQANKIKVEAPKSAEYVKCSFCKKILSKRDLKEHVDMTHLKVTKFRCHLCSRGFSYKHQFNNHINHCIADLKYEDRPHKCNHKDCEKFFISSLHLKLHQLTHSGARPFNYQIQQVKTEARHGRELLPQAQNFISNAPPEVVKGEEDVGGCGDSEAAKVSRRKRSTGLRKLLKTFT